MKRTKPTELETTQKGSKSKTHPSKDLPKKPTRKVKTKNRELSEEKEKPENSAKKSASSKITKNSQKEAKKPKSKKMVEETLEATKEAKNSNNSNNCNNSDDNDSFVDWLAGEEEVKGSNQKMMERRESAGKAKKRGMEAREEKGKKRKTSGKSQGKSTKRSTKSKKASFSEDLDFMEDEDESDEEDFSGDSSSNEEEIPKKKAQKVKSKSKAKTKISKPVRSSKSQGTKQKGKQSGSRSSSSTNTVLVQQAQNKTIGDLSGYFYRTLLDKDSQGITADSLLKFCKQNQIFLNPKDRKPVDRQVCLGLVKIVKQIVKEKEDTAQSRAENNQQEDPLPAPETRPSKALEQEPEAEPFLSEEDLQTYCFSQRSFHVGMVNRFNSQSAN